MHKQSCINWLNRYQVCPEILRFEHVKFDKP